MRVLWFVTGPLLTVFGATGRICRLLLEKKFPRSGGRYFFLKIAEIVTGLLLLDNDFSRFLVECPRGQVGHGYGNDKADEPVRIKEGGKVN